MELTLYQLIQTLKSSDTVKKAIIKVYAEQYKNIMERIWVLLSRKSLEDNLGLYR